MRLHIIPQYPTKMRYQEFFFSELPKQMKKHFDEVFVNGIGYQEEIDIYDKGMFSPIKNSIKFELLQLENYLNYELKDDDILLLMDISFPGIFSNILYHKRPNNCFVYCHATAKNPFDYFEKDSTSKFLNETAHSKLFKKVFVGSEYHKKELGWSNVEVIGLPIPPFQTFKDEKVYDIISVARKNNQKITKEIEDLIEKDFGKIERQTFNNWEQYYEFLSQSKILLITSKADTFNYTILEAIMNNTVVLAPNRLAYPELLPKEYLYDSYEDLKVKIEKYLKDPIPPKRILCHDLCENFYENLANHMKKG